jgi:endonuclease G, mitochondrial
MSLVKTQGYREDFIPGHCLPFPLVTPALQNDLLEINPNKDHILHYIHYSLVMSKSRRFTYCAAANMDGGQTQDIKRDKIFDSGRDEWSLDTRIDQSHQRGSSLYTAKNSTFDKGHVTAPGMVSWETDPVLAKEACRQTFTYTNAVPQHRGLNSAEWRMLEDYVLQKQALLNHSKISVFTGPVLDPNDPVFITELHQERIRIPRFFWKVIVFEKKDGQLYAAGFIMSQLNLLKKAGLIQRLVRRLRSMLSLSTPEDKLIIQFPHAATYQVRVSTIEQLSGIQFSSLTLKEVKTDTSPVRVILDAAAIQPGIHTATSKQSIRQSGFELKGVEL